MIRYRRKQKLEDADQLEETGRMNVHVVHTKHVSHDAMLPPACTQNITPYLSPNAALQLL